MYLYPNTRGLFFPLQCIIKTSAGTGFHNEAIKDSKYKSTPPRMLH